MEKTTENTITRTATTLLYIIGLFWVDSGRLDTLQGFLRRFMATTSSCADKWLKSILEPSRPLKRAYIKTVDLLANMEQLTKRLLIVLCCSAVDLLGPQYLVLWSLLPLSWGMLTASGVVSHI